MDELAALEEKLFSAARSERADPAARARALTNALVEARARRRIPVGPVLGAVALAAGVGLLIWLGGGTRAPLPIDREKLSVAAPSASRSAPSSDANKAALQEPALQASSQVAPRALSAPRPAASLSEELAILEQARAALADGSASRSLELLDRYDRALRGTRLRAEATMLRIEALAAAGRTGEAARLARKFVAENPGSPLVDRARTFVRGDEETVGKQGPGGKP